MDRSLDYDIMPFFSFCYSLYFEVWYKYGYSGFLLLTISVIDGSPSPYFQSEPSGLKSLGWVSCKQHIDGSCFLIHSVTLFLLIAALSQLTFRVSTEIYEFIAIMFLYSWSFWWCSLGLSSFCCFWSSPPHNPPRLFSPQRVPLKISCRAGLVVTNSFKFCLSGKLCLSWVL